MLTYLEAVKELYYSLYGFNPTNFHTELYCLIGKADPSNKGLLRLAYTMEVKAWDDLQASPNQAEFFERFGFKVPGQ